MVAAVGRLARVVCAELDAAELAKAIARLLLETFRLKQSTVALEEHRRITYAATARADGTRLLEPDDAAARALQSFEARRLVLLGPGEPSRDGHALTEALRAEGLPHRGPIALIPVSNHQGRCVCQLLLVADEAQGFPPQDLELAKTFADQISVGIERARVLDRLADWTRGMQALLTFSAEINRRRETPILIRHLVEHAGHFLEADGGLSGLLEESEHGPCMVSSAYWDGDAWHEERRSWRAGEGIPGFVLESEFPCLVDDYTHDARAEPDYRERRGVHFAISVPIKSSADRPVGFFELHRAAGQQPFTWQDAAFLESLANTTAVAIENLQLMDQLEIKGQQVRTLSAGNVQRLEEERRHISRELHDEAGQALVGIKLGLEVMARRLPQEPEALREQLAELGAEVTNATHQIKNLAQRLRPPTLDRLGLDMALQQLASEFSSRGLRVELIVSLGAQRLPQEVETALFRIAQEALTNTALHAEAQNSTIKLEADIEQISLTITDDGVGFDPCHLRGGSAQGGGLGLLGMRERVAMLGGNFHLETRAGAGTRLEITVRAPGDGW